MNTLRRRFFSFIGGISTISLATVCTAATPDQTGPTQQELMQKLEQMQAKIDRLESQVAQQAQPSVTATQASNQEVIEQVAKDAEKRSQMLDTDGALVGGWNAQKKQFYLGSEDGSFYFHPIAIFQIRGSESYRDDAKKSGDSDTEGGFEIRRAKFGMDGNLFTPDLTYKLQWQDTSIGVTGLEYAWVQDVFAHNVFDNADLAIQAGQTKNIIFKEEVTSDTAQIMVDRSLANTLVGGNAPPLNLTQGVGLLLLGKENPLHAEIELTDGYGSGNSNFTQPHGTAVTFPQTPGDPPTNPGNIGAAARVDYKVFGDWADTNDLTGQNSGKKDLLDIGAGVDYSDGQGVSAVRYTVDAQYQAARKLVLFIAGYGSHFDFRDTAAAVEGSQNNYGAMAEGGYSLTNAWQLIGRYSVSKLDNAFQIADTGTFQEYSIGANWFGPNGAWGNHAKFTVDLNYLPNGTPSAPGLDYLASPGNAEVVLRMQFTIWL